MSIIDKLPKAPEGYDWESDVFVNDGNTRIYLNLKANHKSPAVGYQPEQAPTHAFLLADEVQIIEAAYCLVENLESNRRKDNFIKLKTSEARKKYAHLLTES